jgi:hypothetical protein
MYFTSHHGHDGYPEWLGLKVLQLIRQPNAIATYRQVFGEMLDGLKSIMRVYINDFSIAYDHDVCTKLQEQERTSECKSTRPTMLARQLCQVNHLALTEPRGIGISEKKGEHATSKEKSS